MQEQLYFYYTNDLHSDFEHWSRVTGYFKDKATQRKERNESYWTVDIGDHVDRVNPIAEAFMGKANVELLNQADYDIVTLGNNEGMTLSHEDLYELYDEAHFDVVCANLHSMRENPAWLNSTVHVESSHGVKIGVIGLTAPFNDFYELLDWHISSPIPTLANYIEDLKESTDIIVLLSHLGLSEDQELAKTFPDIDLIIGGHTHHLLRTGEEVNNTLITAAGKHCQFVGEVILTWDHERKQLVHKEAYTTDITHLPKDLPTEQHLLELNRQAQTYLNRTVVHLDQPIEVNWFSHTDVMQNLSNTMKTWTNADCAMLNAGLLLDGLSAGEVSYGDVHAICPHPINPCVVELNGNELLEVIRASLTKDFMELKLNGFGFRGEVLGQMFFSELELNTHDVAGGQYFVESASINGERLLADKTYTVALPDMFTLGQLLPEVARSEVKKYFLPEFIRDLLVDTLKKQYD